MLSGGFYVLKKKENYITELIDKYNILKSYVRVNYLMEKPSVRGFGKKNIWDFFSEYGSIWIFEYINYRVDNVSVNFFDKDLWGKYGLVSDFENNSLDKIIFTFNLSRGSRIFLEKKYLNFIHKKSLFFLTNSLAFSKIGVNYYFFYDFTEVLVKFINRKIIFGNVGFNFGFSTSFGFVNNLKNFIFSPSNFNCYLAKLAKLFNGNLTLSGSRRPNIVSLKFKNLMDIPNNQNILKKVKIIKNFFLSNKNFRFVFFKKKKKS